MRANHDAAAAHERTVGAIVLAGGRSRRMGQPKAWLDLGGKPALVRIAELLDPLAQELVVVTAADQDLPAVDARVVRDRAPDLGPLPALALGLATIRAPYACVVACDTPLVRPALLAWLLARCRRGDADAVIPRWNDRLQPLVAVYRRRLAPRLHQLAAAGERRLQVLGTLPGIDLVAPDEIRGLDPDGASFRPMNTPAEYEAIRRSWPDS